MLEIDLTGQTLGGYTLVSKIGQGGMATVYKAYESALERYVAIKILPPALALETGFSERFAREAKAIAKLDHPNILPIYSYGQHAHLSYLVMRYVQAGTLKDLMRQPLALPHIAELIHQIGDALQYAHDNGIIHRDIKPSNILMANPHWALLTDFGLAKMMQSTSHLTGTGVGVGTPAYMSPEQAQGLEVDGRTDVYSLGIMLYEMVIGKVPYEAETPMAVVLKHISAPLPLPSEAKPDILEDVQSVILKALAKNPADRFQSVAALVQALDKAVVRISQQAETRPAVTRAPIQTPPTLPPMTEETGTAPLASQPAVQETIATTLPPPPTAETVVAPAKSKPGTKPRIRIQVWQFVTGALVLLLVIAAARWRSGIFPAFEISSSAASTSTPVPNPNVPPTEIVRPTPIPTPYKPTFILRMLTTSDWFSVTLSGAAVKSSPVIKTSGTPRDNSRDGQRFNLGQELYQGFAGHEVSVTREVFLSSGVETLKDMPLALDAGCLGESQVEILNTQVEPPVVVFHAAIINCHPTSFTLSAEKLKTSAPQAVVVAAPRPILPPSVNSDQSKVFIICPNTTAPNQQLCVVEFGSGKLRQVTTNLNFAWMDWAVGTSGWDPSGQQFYFDAMNTSNAWTTYAMNEDGSGLRKLPTTNNLSWSPDGLYMAYNTECLGIRIAKPDGSARRFLDTGAARCVSWIRWSPDGLRLAFVDLFDWDTTPPSIWVINQDGSGLMRLFKLDELIWVHGLAWNPEGTLVGFWYETREGRSNQGLLLDVDQPGKAQPIDWYMPVWWTPLFWPQWGITR